MASDIEALAALRNLGHKSADMLSRAGIDTVEELRKLGAVEAYIAVKQTGVPASLNLLYAIEGALTDEHWSRLPDGRRESLIMEVDARLADEDS